MRNESSHNVGLGSNPILVVDDNEVKRYVTRRILEEAGFLVEDVTTGEGALERLRVSHTPGEQQTASMLPWLVVLDVRLPGMDGFEVCRRIKADPATESVFILHLSGHRTKNQDRIAGMEAGADAYVTVPVAPEVLVSQVRSLLRLADTEQKLRVAARIAEERAEELRASETRLRRITDALPVLIAHVDAEQRYQFNNRAYEDWLGIPANALVGAHVRDAVGEEAYQQRLPQLEAALRGETVHFESTMPHRHRGEVETEILYVPIDTEQPAGGDSNSGFIVLVWDISERKQIERERAEAAARQERIAEMLQRSLLLQPDQIALPGLRVHTEYQPASAESMIGGDFADAYALDEENVALVVGDVTGKGLLAATYTAEVKFALRAFLRESPNPARAMYRLNHYLILGHQFDRSPQPDRYVALCLVVVNTRTWEMTCSTAGAEPPILVSCPPDGAVPAAKELEIAGPVLGMDADADFSLITALLEPGDLLAIATDGITEARRGRGREFFGSEGFAQAAEESAVLESLPAAGKTIVAAAMEFAGGEQRDDICLLLARRTK